MSLTVRLSKPDDESLLKKWLLEPGVLNWFPMINEVEVDDAARIWVGYHAVGTAFTIEKDSEPAGMAVIYYNPMSKLKHQALFAIIVGGKFRGQGIGTELYLALEKKALEMEIELIHLEVYEGNPAIRLYQRLGFVE